MISNKGLFLLSQQCCRRVQHLQLHQPVLGNMASSLSSLQQQQQQQQQQHQQQYRNFTSPAFRRYKKMQSTKHIIDTDTAKSMPTSIHEMDNNVLICVAAMQNHDARIEVLKRHIMAVDDVSYDDACKTFDLIAAKNREGMMIDILPYSFGITTALIAGIGSLPMVFDLNTALWFNKGYVTTDIPPPADLETVLEVGSWTWNWMEPPLGALSFTLLCLQFSRAQIQNLGIKPYTDWKRERRARKLAAAFPKYNSSILEQFSETDPFFQHSFLK